MSIQMITLKKFLETIFPEEVIENIQSYDDSHINKTLRYDIHLQVTYKEYKTLRYIAFTNSIKEQLMTLEIIKTHDNIHFTKMIIFHLLHTVYI